MKVNSEKLWDYIFNLATDEKVRFKVYCDDIYFAEILWNGEEFEWESGTFTSRAFFNPMYDFVPIEEEKEIEKIIIKDMKIQAQSTGNYCYSISQPMKIIINKLNEVIDTTKKLEKNLKEQIK